MRYKPNSYGRIRRERGHRPCRGKYSYTTEIAARMGAQAAITQHKGANVLYVYECPTCERWHMTGNPQKKDQPVTAKDLGAEIKCC